MNCFVTSLMVKQEGLGVNSELKKRSEVIPDERNKLSLFGRYLSLKCKKLVNVSGP